VALKVLSDQNVTARVTDELRAAIHSGEFAPGERLVERRLADMLGVSHIPVREALTRLADEGLVDRLPRRGARVSMVSAEDLDEIASLRTLLEQFVVTRVQERLTEGAKNDLRHVVDTMFDAARRADTAALFEYDRNFHQGLWELAGHRLLTSVAGQLRSRINGFLWAANSVLPPEGQLMHAQAHADLLDAIATGDPEVAKLAMAEHIAISANRIRTTAGIIATKEPAKEPTREPAREQR